jgi:hypothetical protein
MLNGSLRRSREKFASTGLSRGERAGLLPPDGLEQLCRRLKATPTIVLWEWRVCSGSGACALGVKRVLWERVLWEWSGDSSQSRTEAALGSFRGLPRCAMPSQVLVPPVRIELTTPPLPRVCSTPELRRLLKARARCHRPAGPCK